MIMNKIDILNLSYKELENALSPYKVQSFRCAQIFSWLHEKCVQSFDEMTNIPKDLRNSLKEDFAISTLEIYQVLKSKEDGTKKYAFKLSDGNIIESVYMKYEHGDSVCISSQVGCRMGCKFCASTIDGLERNLTAAEMLAQVYMIGRDNGSKISNVVIMGSGEPLDNYDNVVSFVRLINEPKGYNMSQRNITISTCGIVPEILRLANEDLSITLAISLHAPNDELRSKTMPIANKYSIDEILAACKTYFDKTGRRITFEYAVIKDLNDSKDTIIELADILKGYNCHVNLISVNPIKERNFEKVSNLSLNDIKNLLENRSINATIRRRLGSDIDSACGQLRRSIIS